MAKYRMLVSSGGHSEDDEGTMWGGVWLAVRDPYTWFFEGMHFALIIAQSFKDFFPSIVQTLRFGKFETYLIQAPPYVFAYIFTLVVSWSSGRMLEHCWHIVGAISLTLAGTVVMISTLNVGARYFSLFLLCAGPFLGLNIQLSLETTVVPHPRTKRAALIAIANCVSSISHWFTPYFFLQNQKPRYQLGGGCIIVGCGLTIVFCLAAKYWSWRKNKELVCIIPGDLLRELAGYVRPRGSDRYGYDMKKRSDLLMHAYAQRFDERTVFSYFYHLNTCIRTTR